ncbi:MAG: HEPN domain-containing protein [Chitinispirillales bacterium]|jgi:HEPN domain-containing protein|nr:HEPN domain-containing protein [Chitinispirillales bacterium]
MNTQMAEKWLELTDRDLSGAQILLKSGECILACYHCSQAVEKALKAYIFSVLQKSDRDKKYRIHDLIALTRFSELEISEKMLGFIYNLNPLSTEARYEIKQSKILSQLVPEICNQYVLNTEEFVLWIKSKLYEQQSDLPRG